MLSAFANIFKIHDLRRKIIITLLLLVACRIGAHVPTPGVNPDALSRYFEETMGGATLWGLINMFSGGAFQKATILALGIMPYISASIILQLLTAVIPSLEKLAKEGGEEGRRKITQYTRYGTVFLCLIQALFMANFLMSMNRAHAGIVTDPGLNFRLMTMLTMTTGTIFLMWLGEKISEHGIGNGISLIITVNIISGVPIALTQTWQKLNLINPSEAELKLTMVPILLALLIFVVAAIILLTQGQRKIPVQYAKRIVGRKIYTGQSSYIPLRINYGGVIPIIFASAILLFPATIGQMTNIPILRRMGQWLNPGTLPESILYVLLIIFFCYFWTATQFDPIKISNDMKKNGAFIPGIRPGKATATFFERTMNRITLSGAIFLAIIAILPRIISNNIPGVTPSMSRYFGGTGLLIIVGVTLDTMRAIESHLLMRHYDGFMKKGKLRGRY